MTIEAKHLYYDYIDAHPYIPDHLKNHCKENVAHHDATLHNFFASIELAYRRGHHAGLEDSGQNQADDNAAADTNTEHDE